MTHHIHSGHHGSPFARLETAGDNVPVEEIVDAEVVVVLAERKAENIDFFVVWILSHRTLGDYPDAQTPSLGNDDKHLQKLVARR